MVGYRVMKVWKEKSLGNGMLQKSWLVMLPGDSVAPHVYKSTSRMKAANSYATFSTHFKQVTVAITGGTSDGDILLIEVEPSSTITVLKERIEFQTAIPPSQQVLRYNDTQLEDENKTLEQCSIGPDAFLAVSARRPPQQGRAQPGASRAGQSQNRQRAPGESQAPDLNNPEMLRQMYLTSPVHLNSLRQQIPMLADVINQPDRWRQLCEELQKHQREVEEQNRRDEELMANDPMGIEAQTRMAEIIRLKAVDENWEYTREHHPELLARVTMLYIPVEVNGQKVKAFVDSGAQTTIMSPDCAERCGIMRLVNTRMAGIARGVGTAKILGRVGSAQIKIGSSFVACSFTVMEGKDVEMLLGLDMLKSFQACIDLQKNVLRIQNDEVAFLGEADIPGTEEQRADEPVIEGEDGTKIGGITGTIKEEGSSTSKAAQNRAGPSSAHGGASQPAAAAGQASASISQSASFPEAHISQLVDMGMGRTEAIQALTLAGGNVDIAASLVFS
ncbi:uncharacterized protein KY384_003318 [Bacidia gigantensis]|uniref:uncharacterized protein n=1 Tax=Bacidia gigantensis TaxID=2732470 RepID=UPI001D051DAA|nr:uncharacterized protein KY384_003318 [Bacidia gigantensis]KAG8531686.1 hypothetical protein KY384_003318 [Bacidia gigantensis]